MAWAATLSLTAGICLARSCSSTSAAAATFVPWVAEVEMEEEGGGGGGGVREEGRDCIEGAGPGPEDLRVEVSGVLHDPGHVPHELGQAVVGGGRHLPLDYRQVWGGGGGGGG